MVYSYPCLTPLGEAVLYERDGALFQLYFPGDPFRPDSCREQTPLLGEAAAQLIEYFQGTRRTFTVPLAPAGPEFYQRVWQTMLQEVPYGSTISYGRLAEISGYPRAARAVGTANRRCPLPIFIPCHRVIAAGGRLGGYGNVEQKRFLLTMEAKFAPSFEPVHS